MGCVREAESTGSGSVRDGIAVYLTDYSFARYKDMDALYVIDKNDSLRQNSSREYMMPQLKSLPGCRDTLFEADVYAFAMLIRSEKLRMPDGLAASLGLSERLALDDVSLAKDRHKLLLAPLLQLLKDAVSKRQASEDSINQKAGTFVIYCSAMCVGSHSCRCSEPSFRRHSCPHS